MQQTALLGHFLVNVSSKEYYARDQCERLKSSLQEFVALQRRNSRLDHSSDRRACGGNETVFAQCIYLDCRCCITDNVPGLHS